MAIAVPFAAGAAAVDGLLPIGDVRGAIVIVSAGAYDLSQPGPGTGNCTRLFHGMLPVSYTHLSSTRLLW